MRYRTDADFDRLERELRALERASRYDELERRITDLAAPDAAG